jgi:ABC-2 type transport system ATP-binding protein
VSVITVKRAYLELEREGVIVTQQGKGSSVAQSRLQIGFGDAELGRERPAVDAKGRTMSSAAVELRGVGKRYPHFALEDVDLELPHGQILGFIGPNGAGKSTTIRILLGLVHQDRGEVAVLGHRMPREQVQAKRDIGFASEDLRLYGQATLAWHMEFVRSIYPAWDAAYAADLLRRFDLRAEQKIRGLSHGQRVKAALLLILARRAKLLVLDEPTTGLDPVARHEVLGELMAVLADEERTILFSSHNTLDVEQISDQITFIDRGRILAHGDKETFLERWRRIRVELPQGVALPELPGAVQSGGSGRLAVLTTNRFEPAMTAAYQSAGATVQAVEPMTLEEIFVTNVQWQRQGAHA